MSSNAVVYSLDDVLIELMPWYTRLVVHDTILYLSIIPCSRLFSDLNNHLAGVLSVMDVCQALCALLQTMVAVLTACDFAVHDEGNGFLVEGRNHVFGLASVDDEALHRQVELEYPLEMLGSGYRVSGWQNKFSEDARTLTTLLSSWLA